MARIQHGPVVASASGRIGGVVIRQTRFGPVVQTAFDVPPYTTPAALAAKARFRIAQNAWSIMPSNFSDIVTACHKALHSGIPGPWITAMLAYMRGDPWTYRPCTNPEIEQFITSIDYYGGQCRVFLHPILSADWRLVLCLYFHPVHGVDRSLGWIGRFHSGSYVLVPLTALPAGASIVIIPKRFSPHKAIGRGDAHALP